MKSDPWMFTDEWEWTEAPMINLGDKVRDSISGYEGIVIGIGITEWLHQCRRIGIQPTALDKDGKPMAIEWIDEPQCVVVEELNQAPTEKAENGGPKDSPTRNADPAR